jgi:hypothetical protein
MPLVSGTLILIFKKNLKKVIQSTMIALKKYYALET